MNHILSILQKEGLKCLRCDQINLDYERFTEYKDSDEHPADHVFERPKPIAFNRPVMEIDKQIDSIFGYFLDGSRRTYKIADVIVEGRYLPLIAGQVGVAVVHRMPGTKTVTPVKQFCRFENIIAFPRNIESSELKDLQDTVNTKVNFRFSFVSYDVKNNRDPVDLGIARIMKQMQDLEVQVVKELSEQKLLHNDCMLIIDGPLRFKKMRDRQFDIVQFRNVIGLSKRFQPSFTVGKGKKKKDVGLITSQLKFSERSVAFSPQGEDSIGMWYLRIRDPGKMTNPLQGVVKLECYAIDPEDKEQGLDSDRLDIISGHILRERNVTPFKADSRWAAHLYPIYLAETYIKTSFLSDIRFKALF